MLRKRRFSVAAPSVWNSLPLNLRTDYITHSVALKLT